MAQDKWLHPLVSSRLSSKTLINISSEASQMTQDALFGNRPFFGISAVATAYDTLHVTIDLTSMGLTTSFVGYVEYGTTTLFGSVSPDVTYSSTGTYTVDIAVNSNTTYYLRFAAEIASATDKEYSVGISIATPKKPPTAFLDAPVITSSSIADTLGIADIGDYTAAEIFIDYSADNATALVYSTSLGTYTYPTSRTTPHIRNPYTSVTRRARLVYADGEVVSATRTDRTLPNAAAVTTNAVHDITTTEAAVSCELTNIGSFATEGINVGIQYGKASDLSDGIIVPADVLYAAAGYSKGLTDLDPGTLYYVRACVYNMDGLYSYYGTTLSFTTASSGGLNAVLTITSHTADKISDEIGKTTCTVQFTTDIAIGSWEARATYESQTPGPGVGWVVGSGSSLASGATGTFDVTYDELTWGDRVYTISVYQLS